jgi:hypothetical protein
MSQPAATPEPVRDEREHKDCDDIQESCRDKEAADRIGGHPWANI